METIYVGLDGITESPARVCFAGKTLHLSSLGGAFDPVGPLTFAPHLRKDYDKGLHKIQYLRAPPFNKEDGRKKNTCSPHTNSNH